MYVEGVRTIQRRTNQEERSKRSSTVILLIKPLENSLIKKKRITNKFVTDCIEKVTHSQETLQGDVRTKKFEL